MILKSDTEYLPMRLSIEEIDQLLTPENVLNALSFDEKPEIIRPGGLIHCFEDLVNQRDRIRNLQLVPVKNVEMHTLYNGLDKNQLMVDLMSKMGNEQIMFLKNEYPYALPPDIEQHIIWYRDVSRKELKCFIGQIMFLEQLDASGMLSFERPINDETKDVKLIRGTFRNLRHLHFWIKKNDDTEES